MRRVTLDLVQAGRDEAIRRAFAELRQMPKFTHAVLLVLGADALTVRIVSPTLGADATREILEQAAAAARGDRGVHSSGSKLILPQ